ncbi:MAG TPA: hypothetical protein VF784_07810 [Anaerolineales bacterium]
MDMLPDENQDLPQPANDSPEPQPSGAPESPATPETQAPPEGPRASSEDAFAEFRRELREEETQEQKGFGPGLRRLLTRVFRRKKKPVEEAEVPSRLDQLISSQAAEAAEAAAAPQGAQGVPEAKPEEARPESAAAEFRTMVRTKLTDAFLTKEELEPTSPPPETHFEQPGTQPIAPAAEPTVPEEAEAPGAPGRSILSTLHTDQEQEVVEEPSTIREAALEDYVTAPAEGEEEAAPSLVRSVRRSWRDMRPIDRRLLVGALIIVGLAVVSGSGFLVVKSIPTPTPAPTATASILPIPISISLPGGWVFPLGVGAVQNGVWDPTGPQWLQGTEVCRWVSLPWTVQLEAVLRTLKSSDEIKLSMSNYDSVTYKVESIQQVPSGDVGKLAPSTPSLLVILSKQNSSTRWVVIAKP